MLARVFRSISRLRERHDMSKGSRLRRKAAKLRLCEWRVLNVTCAEPHLPEQQPPASAPPNPLNPGGIFMQYDRKIKYFNYYEHGQRLKGAGFVKLELRDNILRLELTIRGLHPTDSFVRDVILVGQETEEILGQITIKEGTGYFKHTCRMEHNIAPTNIPYEELQEIRIPIGGSRDLCCTLKKQIIMPKKQPTDTLVPIVQIIEDREKSRSDVDQSLMKSAGPAKQEDGQRESVEQQGNVEPQESVEQQGNVGPKESIEQQENAEQKESVEQQADVGPQESVEQQENIGLQKSVGQQEDIGLQESVGEQENIGLQKIAEMQENIEAQESTELQKNMEMQKSTEMQGSAELQAMWSQTKPDTDREGRKPVVRLLEDKWQQLSAIYPHIRPFEDDREYISLRPSDFVMFPAKYYRAANNSFLLHGYYNYKHLILVRVERRGEALYYLGVPGNYFDREKQVAVMFGFESFECAQEPARTGDFGYYMMRIEL